MGIAFSGLAVDLIREPKGAPMTQGGDAVVGTPAATAPGRSDAPRQAQQQRHARVLSRGDVILARRRHLGVGHALEQLRRRDKGGDQGRVPVQSRSAGVRRRQQRLQPIHRLPCRFLAHAIAVEQHQDRPKP
jgi:hypothetical protein